MSNIPWGSLYLSMAGAQINLEEALKSEDLEIINIRQYEFRKQLNKYRTLMLKRRKEKRAGNTYSFVEHIFIKKLKAIENTAKYLIGQTVNLQRKKLADKLGVSI